MSRLFDKAHRPILAIMVAVLLWGSLHALGAFLFEHDYRKPLVVYGFLLAFLGFWAAMLAQRNRRLGERQREGTTRKPPEGGADTRAGVD